MRRLQHILAGLRARIGLRFCDPFWRSEFGKVLWMRHGDPGNVSGRRPGPRCASVGRITYFDQHKPHKSNRSRVCGAHKICSEVQNVKSKSDRFVFL